MPAGLRRRERLQLRFGQVDDAIATDVEVPRSLGRRLRAADAMSRIGVELVGIDDRNLDANASEVFTRLGIHLGQRLPVWAWVAIDDLAVGINFEVVVRV